MCFIDAVRNETIIPGQSRPSPCGTGDAPDSPTLLSKSESTMIAYQAADLIWATRIKSAAEDLDLACRPVRTSDMLLARLADSPVRALIVDLDQPEVAIELIRIVRKLEAETRIRAATTEGSSPAFACESGDSPILNPDISLPIRILAFGPHVAKERFQEARDAGADEVLPRGAFDRSLPDILLSLASR